MILFVAIVLVCFVIPAMSVDWNFYGSVRMATYYVSNDLGASKNDTPAGNNGTQDLEWDFQSNSRIGANVKAEHIKGQFELGLKGASTGDVDVGTRRLYGKWEFGSGSLKVGKDYTPVSQFISGQAYDGDLGLLGIGTQYGNRTGQIALSFGGFTIALMTPNNPNIEDENGVATDGDIEGMLPKAEASWGMAFDTWNFGLQGGVQTYTIKDAESLTNPGDRNDIDVTSYTLGATAGVNFGPAYVKGAFAGGQNWNNAAWGLGGNHNQGSPAVWDGDDDVKDTTTYMASLVAGLKVSDMLSFEVGGVYRVDDPDDNGAKKSKPWAVYGQAVIVLAPGDYIIPEVGYFDGDQDFEGDSADNRIYAGGKWQIDF
jgi:hypothetical protein